MHATRRIRNTGGWKAARMLRAAALLLALCLSGGVALRTGATGETYNWYCAHVRGHMQPRADGRFAFIRDCGGFYIDDRPEHTAADGADKVVYLTFDAGYENGNVARVLDALAQADAAGAFFVLGNLARQNPDLIRRMAAEGHLVCNHSYAHRDMTSWSADEIAAELTRLEDACREAGVETAKFFRPPEGRFSESLLRVLELRLCRLGQRPTAFPGGCQSEDTRQSPQWRGHPAAPHLGDQCRGASGTARGDTGAGIPLRDAV